jgi:DNA-binding HxlR family transcriptional regulator
MEGERRSGCPINLTVEMLCDRWSLIVLRGPMFGNRRHYRKLLTRSEEGISTNILADRLRMLMDEGMITKANDATHKPKSVYSLTEKAIALVPIFAQPWGRRYTPATEELSIRAWFLEEGGPAMWDRFVSGLREAHLGRRAQRDGNTSPNSCRPPTKIFAPDGRTVKSSGLFIGRTATYGGPVCWMTSRRQRFRRARRVSSSSGQAWDRRSCSCTASHRHT